MLAGVGEVAAEVWNVSEAQQMYFKIRAQHDLKLLLLHAIPIRLIRSHNIGPHYITYYIERTIQDRTGNG